MSMGLFSKFLRSLTVTSRDELIPYKSLVVSEYFMYRVLGFGSF